MSEGFVPMDWSGEDLGVKIKDRWKAGTLRGRCEEPVFLISQVYDYILIFHLFVYLVTYVCEAGISDI